MKKLLLTFFLIFVSIIFAKPVKAISFDVLVLPVDLFKVCENYYCFPEVSNIIAKDVISNLECFDNINAKSLDDVRKKIYSSPDLKNKVLIVLEKFKKNDSIDFEMLKFLADSFSVKSVVLINSYANNDKTTVRRGLWEILEVCNIFKITYPFYLTTSVVLTDSVNNTVMWSTKFNKKVTDSNGYFMAKSLSQATSQLEKIRFYSKYNISKNISQNINLRFFPKDIRSINLEPEQHNFKPQFMPNALEKLSRPKTLEDIPEDNYDNVNDFIFQF